MTERDVIDSAAGLSSADPRFIARRLRPEFVEGAEICRTSVLAPKDDLGLSRALRAALARRMAALNDDAPLTAYYDAELTMSLPTEEELRLSRGETGLAEPLAAMAGHADLITSDPSRASAEDIRRLERAGLTNPQIVALSELIAFVNFQTRVVAGLRLMGAS
ncbi:esterase [Agaricicola taiwanensis]|uniref:Esterase n=1 Tax=Agaricicola taiwanensis TaxID=591372 RepID=A0A8J2VMW3_9RHOB|nr:esterase [Agaricicola taiwanensis]GGE32412.1 esterase [Agaricicola taiwanensis]